MGKFISLYFSIFSVFATVDWTNHLIKTYPSEFTETGSEEEFIRISIIPGGLGVNRDSISGIMIVDIFTSYGFGPKRYLEIADILDGFLANQTLTVSAGVVVQFSTSSLNKARADVDNPSLLRTQYLIPFNYNGVL